MISLKKIVVSNINASIRKCIHMTIDHIYMKSCDI
jgi:hypothetical protein